MVKNIKPQCYPQRHFCMKICLFHLITNALIALVIDKPVILATWPSVSVILALQSAS